MYTRLKQLRKTLNLTQEKFSSGAGINTSTYANYENGRTRPSDAAIHAICTHYGVSKKWLLTGEGTMLLSRDNEEGVVEWARSICTEEKNEFERRFALMVSEMTPEQWNQLMEIVHKLTD